MKRLSKIILAVESALVTSAIIFAMTIEKIPLIKKVVWIELTEEVQQWLGLTEPYLKITQTEGLITYPYQTIGLSLLLIAGIVGFGFGYMNLKSRIKLIKWKSFKIGRIIIIINKPIINKQIKKKRQKTYVEEFFEKHPNLR